MNLRFLLFVPSLHFADNNIHRRFRETSMRFVKHEVVSDLSCWMNEVAEDSKYLAEIIVLNDPQSFGGVNHVFQESLAGLFGSPMFTRYYRIQQ